MYKKGKAKTGGRKKGSVNKTTAVLKEKITSFTLSVMLCAALGVSLMFLNGSGSKSNYGLFMALLTAISFSVFAIILRKNRNIEMLPALAISGIIISL